MNTFQNKTGEIDLFNFIWETDEQIALTSIRDTELVKESGGDKKSGLINERLLSTPSNDPLKEEFEIYCEQKLLLIQQGRTTESRDSFLQKKASFTEKMGNKESGNWNPKKYAKNLVKFFPDYNEVIISKITETKNSIYTQADQLIAAIEAAQDNLLSSMSKLSGDQIKEESVREETESHLETSRTSMYAAISILSESASGKQSEYEKKYNDVINNYIYVLKTLTATIDRIAGDKEKLNLMIDQLTEQKNQLAALKSTTENVTGIMELVVIDTNKLAELTKVINANISEVETTTQAATPYSPTDIGKTVETNTSLINTYTNEVELIEFEKKAQKGIYGKPIQDPNTYYIFGEQTIAHNDSNPREASKTKITKGIQIKRLAYYRYEKNKEVWNVEVIETNGMTGVTTGQKIWIASSNIIVSQPVDNNEQFISFYKDLTHIDIYENPYGEKTKELKGGKTVSKTAPVKDVEFKLTEQCGEFVKIKQGEEVIGWVKSSLLVSKDKQEQLKRYQEWLEERYKEISAIENREEKVNRLEGMLEQIETTCYEINKSGNYPDLNTLDKTPSYTSQQAHLTYTPPGLVVQVRKFIGLLDVSKREGNSQETEIEACEAVIKNSDNHSENKSGTSASNDKKISVSPTIDWNARLGAQQYRTQSDNLTPPETTCGVTSFSMAAERVGYSRDHILQAIDRMIRKDMKKGATSDEFDKEWKAKATAFMKSLTGDNYQQLRNGTKGGLLGKESKVAESFREWGQYEDLLFFLGYLNNIKTTEITIETNARKIISRLENTTENKVKELVERVDINSDNPFDIEMRNKIKATLDSGGGVILSLYHKGSKGSGTHIVTVREVTPEGLALDDPYGQINPEYRKKKGTDQDAYINTGKGSSPSDRSSYNWKNVPEFSPNEKDYSKQDFTEAAAEKLQDNEQRGNKSFISWEMIKESSNLLNYIEFIKRKKE